MAWSYSGDPTSNEKDAVRFLIGDTDAADPLVADEEIVYALSVTSSPIAASVVVLRSLASRYARYADKQVGDLRIALSQKAEAFRKLAEELGDEETSGALSSFGGPVATGTRVSEVEDALRDTDRRHEYFRPGAHDHPPGEPPVPATGP